jgi:Helix-turn-helix domain
VSVTLAEICQWPATVDVRQGARALGISKSAAYEAIRTGTFPVKVIKAGGSYRVVTAALVKLLSQTEAASSP